MNSVTKYRALKKVWQVVFTAGPGFVGEVVETAFMVDL
jgi:hypothetical protein